MLDNPMDIFFTLTIVYLLFLLAAFCVRVAYLSHITGKVKIDRKDGRYAVRQFGYLGWHKLLFDFAPWSNGWHWLTGPDAHTSYEAAWTSYENALKTAERARQDYREYLDSTKKKKG